MDRNTYLLPLGIQRLRLLDCLGGNSPHAPGYFAPSFDVDVFVAFRQYIARLSERWAETADPSSMLLIAAARVATGDLPAARIIINHLLAEIPKLDHGAGFCLLTPFYALRAALPLPKDLTDTDRWLAGSAEQAALGAWLTEHASNLRWDEASGAYHLAGILE